MAFAVANLGLQCTSCLVCGHSRMSPSTLFATACVSSTQASGHPCESSSPFSLSSLPCFCFVWTRDVLQCHLTTSMSTVKHCCHLIPSSLCLYPAIPTHCPLPPRISVDMSFVPAVQEVRRFIERLWAAPQYFLNRRGYMHLMQATEWCSRLERGLPTSSAALTNESQVRAK